MSKRKQLVSKRKQLGSDPLFVTALMILIFVTSPIWIPLAMCACIATGKSLKDFNQQANAMSGMED